MSILSEISVVKHTLHQVADQAYNLAMGLQNAAPIQAGGGVPRSVQYLLEIALQINKINKTIEEVTAYDSLASLLREISQNESELRVKYSVAEKFRFVKDKLHVLLAQLEEKTNLLQSAVPTAPIEDITNTIAVYVYLYNAQGIILRSWSPMFTPKVFYEYSVNRPIYREKNAIEAMLRSKVNKQQHGYLTIKINQTDIVLLPELAAKNAENGLIKVREGSLKFENMLSFTHNDQAYTLNAEGELIKI